MGDSDTHHLKGFMKEFHSRFGDQTPGRCCEEAHGIHLMMRDLGNELPAGRLSMAAPRVGMGHPRLVCSALTPTSRSNKV